MANGIIGAGIVGLPFALSQGGFLYGCTMLVLCCYLTHYTLTLMIETGRAHGRFSYEELCELAFGVPGFYALSMFQFFNSFGACIVYMLVVSTTVPPVTLKYLGDLWWVFGDSTMVTVFVCSMLILPLSLYRDISYLEKWSMVSLFSVVAMSAAIAFTFVNEENISALNLENQTFMLYDVHDQWLPSIGVIAFAFGCQQYSFFVFSTLERPTRTRWWLVSCFATIIALLLSLTLGVFGYLRYGSKALPNILDNLNHDSVLANMMRIVLAVTMCLTFPLDFFVVRYTVQRFFQRCCSSEWDDDHALPSSSGNRGTLVFSPVFTRQNLRGRGHASDLSSCSHVGSTVAMWSACLGVSVLAIRCGGDSAGLGLVLTLTGSIGTIFTAFVFPTATFIRLGTNDYLRPEQTWFCWCCTPNMYKACRYLFAWFVLFFGVSSGCIGTFVAIMNSQGGGGSGGHNGTSPSPSSDFDLQR
jgi:amino acid permease